jgi:crossover junction endodeoxyribonuclease RusA
MRGGKIVLVEASKKIEPWRKAVAKAAVKRLEETGEVYFDGAVEVWVKFFLPKPPSNKSLYPIVPPDLDKLERGIYDAITIAKLWKDDSLVVRSHATKLWSPDGLTGAHIIIESVTHPDQLK